MRKFFQLYSRNINRLSIGIYLFSLILLFKIFNIQIINKDTFKKIVENKGYKIINRYGLRGDITDKNNKILSQTISKYTFWINTNKSFEKDKIINLFSKNFNKPDFIIEKVIILTETKNLNMLQLKKMYYLKTVSI